MKRNTALRLAGITTAGIVLAMTAGCSAGGGDDGGAVTYRVHGALFFASSNDLYSQFEYALDPPCVVIDMGAAHVWDASTVAALDSVLTKYAQHGIHAEVTGLNEASAAMHARLSGRLDT